MKVKNILFYLVLIITIVSCDSEKKEPDSEADKYLKKIRSIYRPLVENHSLIISEVFTAYNYYHKNKEACDEATIKRLWDLKNKQNELILIAKKQLDTIPDDVSGFVQSVHLLTQNYTYGVSPCWELMTLNLSYYSPNEQIVFIGSHSNEEPIWDTLFISNDIKIDTTEHFGLTQGKYTTNKIGLGAFNGLSIGKFILYLTESLDEIEYSEQVYCEDNKYALTQDLIENNKIDMARIYQIQDSLDIELTK